MKVFSMKMPEEVCAAIDELAKANYRTRTGQVRAMLNDWLEWNRDAAVEDGDTSDAKSRLARGAYATCHLPRPRS